MAKQPLLRIRNLTKAFGPIQVLEALNLTLYAGEVYGLLGPNGAGKTTLLSILFGLVRPDAGQIEWDGHPVPPGRPECLTGIEGFIDTPAFYPHLSALENLRISLRRRGQERDAKVLMETLARVGLEQAAHRPVGGFSTGMKKRLGVARALLFRPKLLILDEPTSGLDPTGVREMRQLIRNLKAQGITVLFSSHMLNEVEQVADRVGVLHQGRMLLEDTLRALTAPTRIYWFQVDDPERARTLLEQMPRLGTLLRQKGDQLQIRLSDSVTPGDVNRYLLQRGVLVHGLWPQRTRLETVFFQVLGLHDPTPTDVEHA